MSTSTPSYLDPAALAAIATLEMRARTVVEGALTGMHPSPYQGFNVEFAQHRPYTPGDDLRHLDWKVYGRADKLYLKQYQKETNLDLVILVDTSGSMAYSSQHGGRMSRSGGWRKYDHAATLAAVLAHLALRQQDRVGLMLFTDQVNAATRTSNTHGHWQSIVETMATQEVALPADPAETAAGRQTDLEHVFEQVLAKLSQRSLIVLVSDLLDSPDALERGLARVQFGRHDLIILQTLDPAELTFPFRAQARFIGLEGEGELGMDPPALRDAYLAAMRDHLAQIEQAARRMRFDYLLLDTSQHLGTPLSRFLAFRAAVLKRGR